MIINEDESDNKNKVQKFCTALYNDRVTLLRKCKSPEVDSFDFIKSNLYNRRKSKKNQQVN